MKWRRHYRILSCLHVRSKAVSVRLGLPRYRFTPGGPSLETLVLPYDAVATIPLVNYVDAAGNPANAPTGTPSFKVDDPTVCSAAMAQDGKGIEVAALTRAGTTQVALVDQQISVQFTVSVVHPEATGVTLDIANASFRNNPNPPAEASGTDAGAPAASGTAAQAPGAAPAGNDSAPPVPPGAVAAAPEPSSGAVPGAPADVGTQQAPGAPAPAPAPGA